MTLPANVDLPNYPFPANARQFDFEFIRMLVQALGTPAAMEGIAGSTTADLAASAGAGLAISVAAGRAFVKGDDRATQGSYFCYVPAAQSVTAAAAHATLPRIDRLVLRVYDADVSGATTKWAIELVQGTPTAGATLTNLLGAASVPNGAFLLYNVLVPAAFAGPFVPATHFQDRRFNVPIAGRELFGGYTEITGNATNAAATPSSVITHTVNGDGVTPVMVESWVLAMASTGAAATTLLLRLYDGTTAGTQLIETDFSSPGATYFSGPQQAKRRVAAFSGAKQFTLAFLATSGTCTFYANAQSPAHLRTTWAG